MISAPWESRYHYRCCRHMVDLLRPELKAFITEKLKLHWFPEHVAGYLKHVSHKCLYVCHETINRFNFGIRQIIKIMTV